jgi:hypothetical protein
VGPARHRRRRAIECQVNQINEGFIQCISLTWRALYTRP